MPNEDSALLSKSFELVYYDPSSRSEGRTYFKDETEPSLTTDQRFEYLSTYSRALKDFYGLGDDFLATAVVSDRDLDEIKKRMKEKPAPEVRQVIPLRYWRWKLERDSDSDTGWTQTSFDDETWNELETPRLTCMNRSLLLRSRFSLGDFDRVWLDIESIIDEYDVWVNGEHLYRHAGFEPTRFGLQELLHPNEENCLAIRVEDREGEQIGIAGKVNLLVTGDVMVDDLFVFTKEVQGTRAKVELRATLRNTGREAFKGALENSFNKWFPNESEEASLSASFEVELEGGEEKEYVEEYVLSDAEPWAPWSPNLYKVSATLRDGQGVATDDLIETFGIRTIEQRDGKIYFNGEEFFVKSVGDSLGFAPGFDSHGAICPPDDWLITDLLLAKEAGCNTLRIHPAGFTSKRGRYTERGFPEQETNTDATNYERIAEFADQLGICLIWGTRGWTTWPNGFRKSYREKDFERLLVSSLKRVRNHPSIIVYEGMNEFALVRLKEDWGPGDLIGLLTKEELAGVFDTHAKRFKEYCKRFVSLANSVDGSRLVCPDSPWGPHHSGDGSHYDEDLLLTENVYWDLHTYKGWYEDFKEMYDWQDKYWPEGKKRPFLLTEFGAEAMPDWRLYKGLPWHGIWLNNGRPNGGIERARLGRPLKVLEDSEVNLSQAYQGLCLQQVITYVRATGADGMNITHLADGLQEGNYHKGMCDLYRKAKAGFFSAMMSYQDIFVSGLDGTFLLSKEQALKLVLVKDRSGLAGDVTLSVNVLDADGRAVDESSFDIQLADKRIIDAGQYKPKFPKEGLYQVQYTVVRKEVPAVRA